MTFLSCFQSALPVLADWSRMAEVCCCFFLQVARSSYSYSAGSAGCFAHLSFEPSLPQSEAQHLQVAHQDLAQGPLISAGLEEEQQVGVLPLVSWV